MKEIMKRKIVSGCKKLFQTVYIAVIHYGLWLLIFLKGADANEVGIG